MCEALQRDVMADKAEAETQEASSQGFVLCNLRDPYLQQAGPPFHLLEFGRPYTSSLGYLFPC
jgi:hypothetical protein